MPKQNFMQIVVAAADSIRDDLKNTTSVIREIQHLPKKDAVLVTAYVCDQLHGEQGYTYFLAALARQT
jgi:hypothetical protein